MKKIIIFLSLFLPLLLCAKIQTTYLVVEGSGSTKTQAIRNGLIEAIKQTNGVAIKSKRLYSKSIKEAAISLDGDSSHGVSISEKSQKYIQEATKGFVRNYRIIDSYQENGDWVVKLRIKILKYKSPGFNPNKRRKMAVIPFEYKSKYAVMGGVVSGKIISQRFTQALVSKMTQTRKFTMLDRENSKYYNSEKSFLLSGNSSKNELLKLGKRLGTDYLLVGQILNYSVKKIVTHSSIGLPDSSETVCNATISYRVLMMATQQIKWSETINQTIKLDEKGNFGSAEALVATTMSKIANTIMNNILNNIYPPMIVAVTSNSIVINQGGNSIKVGDVLKVFKKGTRLVDPYTHEYLGYEEIEAGEIKVKTVKPKVSYASLIKGVAFAGMIARKQKSSAESQNKGFHSEGEAESNVKIKANGGVVLPF